MNILIGLVVAGAVVYLLYKFLLRNTDWIPPTSPRPPNDGPPTGGPREKK